MNIMQFKSATSILGIAALAVSMLAGTASAQQSYRPGQSFSTSRDGAAAQSAPAPAPAPTATLPVFQPQVPASAAPVRKTQQQTKSTPAKASSGNLYNLNSSNSNSASKPASTASKSTDKPRTSAPAKAAESKAAMEKKSSTDAPKSAAKPATPNPARETADAGQKTKSTPAPAATASAPDSTDKLVFFSRKTGKKQVALTYDDGPNPNLTPKLMDWLKANNVPATFFVQGSMVKAFPDLTKRIANDGFELANHTFSHPDLRKQTPEKITNELQDTHDLVKELTSIDMRLMRPPYGAHNAKVNQICEKLGYKIINWDVDTEDWRSRSAEAMVQTIMSKTGDGSIILMHDRLHKGKESVLETTKAVVPLLRARGYTFVTVGELLDQPQSRSSDRSIAAKAPAPPAATDPGESASVADTAAGAGDALPAPAAAGTDATSDTTAMLNLLP